MNIELKNSEEFITNKVGKKTGFKVLENYFESLEDAIFTRLSEELFTKQTGFETPSNYFNNLEETILTKISSEEKVVKVIPLYTRIARFASIASAACVLLFVGFQLFSSSETISFDTLAFGDVENWVENNIVLIDSYELNDAFKISDFDGNELLLSEISDETIENYLTNVDTSTLLNEID